MIGASRRDFKGVVQKPIGARGVAQALRAGWTDNRPTGFGAVPGTIWGRIAMGLNVDHLLRTAATLEQAVLAVQRTPPSDEVFYDLYRNAAIKSFELSLETAGKLMRKALKLFGANPREVDRLVFNEVLRHCGKHGVLDVSAVERWLQYRANRNSTAHDYGVGFANQTLGLLPDFLVDVRALAAQLQRVFDAAA